jgi:hypothetical protein
MIIKSRRMRLVGRLAHGVMRTAYKILVRNLKEGDYLEDPGIDRRIIFRLILKKQGVIMWTGFIWFRMGTSSGLL